MVEKNDNTTIIACVFGAILTIWIALLIAPYVDEGLVGIINNLSNITDNFYDIKLCKNSLNTVLFFLLFYFLGIATYYSTRKNYRKREEHGSAKWGNAKRVNKKYASKNLLDDKLFTRNVRMKLDGHQTRRNLNTVIIGGSGAGKTRFYAKPNIMQCNTSFVCLDPKGELIESLGGMLEKEGYVIKVLDLIQMERSHGYNPFHYIKEDKDLVLISVFKFRISSYFKVSIFDVSQISKTCLNCSCVSSSKPDNFIL